MSSSSPQSSSFSSEKILSDASLEPILAAMRRRRLVFLQSTPLVERLLDVAELPNVLQVTSLGEIPTDVGAATHILVKPFDLLLRDFDPTRSLGQARITATALVDAGHSVCLVSRVPRISFPKCPGSSLLEDAHVFHADTWFAHAGNVWSDDVDARVLRQHLELLGPDVLACLDYLLFDLQVSGSVSTELISPLELEAIRGAGLFEIDETGDFMSTAVRHSLLMPAVADAIVNHLGVQPDYAAVASALVEVERRIRRTLQKRAADHFGEKWRGAALDPDLATKVVGRASSELSRPTTVKGLRNPLEWLTLGELIELTRNASWTERLGREDGYWHRFATEVMPVRNRISHMRFLRQQDRARVEHWRTALALTFR